MKRLIILLLFVLYGACQMRAPVITDIMEGPGLAEYETRYINIKDPPYRAKGNGVADDTARIQAAINDVSAGQIVYIPRGDFLFTNLVINKSIRLQGEGATYRWMGASATILRHTGAGDAITIDNATAENRGAISLRDFELTPSVAGAGQHGISLVQTGAGSMRGIDLTRLAIHNFGGSAIYGSGTVFDVTLNRIFTIANVDDGVKVVKAGGTPSQWRFTDCFLLSNTGVWAVNINLDSYNFILGTIAGQDTGHGIKVSGIGALSSLSIEGAHGAGSIGLQFMGDCCVANGCSTFSWDTGIKIGDGTGLAARGFFYRGHVAGSNDTLDIHVTSGGSRSGCKVIQQGFAGSTWIPVVQNDRAGDGAYDELSIETSQTDMIIPLANDATPSVAGLGKCRSGGVIAITDFDDGIAGQIITFIAEHAITITDGTNIYLNGSQDRAMAIGDTMELVCKADNKWYEIPSIGTSQTYTETNVTPDRAFDADTVAIAELADIVGTLIVDLRAKSIVK